MKGNKKPVSGCNPLIPAISKTGSVYMEDLAQANSSQKHFGRLLSDGSRAPLGNYTKCSSPCGGENTSAGRATAGFLPLKKLEKSAVKSIAQRAIRYSLQNESRRLHLKDVSDDLGGLDALNEAHRVCKCRRTRISPEVEIRKSSDSGKAFYSGLSICGSVWACPVCNGKIQEVRRAETKIAVDWSYGQRKTVTMITFTFPHYAFQSCKELLDKQRDAFKYLRSGKAWQEWKSKVGFVGLIRSLEVNHGANGWHPHTHELWIHDKMPDLKDQQKFSRFVHDRWKKACKKYGLIPYGKTKAFDLYATDFKFNCSTSDYLLKTDDQSAWGIDREMTKSSMKESKKGRPPFALLADSAKGCKKSGSLFLEYSEAFKGKSQLFWARGLKKLIGVNQLTDEEVAENNEEDNQIIAKLECFGWIEVCSRDSRAEILDIAELFGYEGVYNWLVQHGLYDSGNLTY